ncbi:MAG: histidine triad nucleotide-binding protein [Acidimicrobiia bacterium]|nr:histidine triad nucleotide-binding protein [Acidimicrobiia bacterium]MBT8192391.1 histidine triad nucleotide-binding protein [Acidimicrobiia bacterium]MBT8247172.1 histidine triad nucleotide-binding protein [Acidimicrobiia bacterium]NNF87071.1 histidine triad nucleotide-binding protein [Acidimicrobiia bacterium]NNJ47712.1 histidine triad nucleotide-binding protein [Acidimicrobiia bacterium]
MADCLFCSIAAGDIPADIVLETDDVVAFNDINPAAPTHVLVIPKRHVASAAELEADDAPLLSALFDAAARVGEAVEGGWRLVTNVGPDAGQSVFHLHFHVLGGRRLGWPPG